MECYLIRAVRKGPPDKEQSEQKPIASSHADEVGDGEKEFQAEGTAIAKALRREYTLFFRTI